MKERIQKRKCEENHAQCELLYALYLLDPVLRFVYERWDIFFVALCLLHFTRNQKMMIFFTKEIYEYPYVYMS